MCMSLPPFLELSDNDQSINTLRLIAIVQLSQLSCCSTPYELIIDKGAPQVPGK